MKRWTTGETLDWSEDPNGNWVRYEDAAAELRDERLASTGRINALHEMKSEAQAAAKASHAELEALRARVTELEADADSYREISKGYFAELEALKARVTRAIAHLAEPEYWSEFARKALKELRGG